MKQPPFKSLTARRQYAPAGLFNNNQDLFLPFSVRSPQDQADNISDDQHARDDSDGRSEPGLGEAVPVKSGRNGAAFHMCKGHNRIEDRINKCRDQAAPCIPESDLVCSFKAYERDNAQHRNDHMKEQVAVLQQ